jgi:hypothetical protein
MSYHRRQPFKADPIVDEVRAVREEHAAQFGYNLKAIFEDIRTRQQASKRQYVRYPARPVKTAPKAGAE